MRLNADKGSFPTNDAALEGLRKRLAAWGLPDGSYQLVDGSGLVEARRDLTRGDHDCASANVRASGHRLSRRAADCRRGRFARRAG